MSAPPHDIAAEQGLIGGCLALGDEAVAEAMTLVQTDDFYEPKHRAIWSAIQDLFEANQPLDEINLCSKLQDNRDLDRIGGPVSVAELADMVVGPAHVELYAKRVRDKAKRRAYLHALDKAKAAVLKPGDDAEALEEADRLITDARAKTAEGQAVSNAEVVDLEWTRLNERRKLGYDPNALSTGFPVVDRVMAGGMRPNDLIIVAARPGMGKTALASAITDHVACRENKPVLFCSMEQSEGQMIGRMMCAGARVDGKTFLSGKGLTPVDIANLSFQRDRLKGAPIYWGMDIRNMQQLAVRVRLLKAKAGLSLMVFDYIQRVVKRENNEEVGAVSNALKNIAKDINVPVMALSQLNREVDKRNPPKPIMSDLRASGTIEQDADIIFLLYREAGYDQNCGHNTVEVILGKHRAGPKSKLLLTMIPEYIRFEPHDGVYPENERRMF